MREGEGTRWRILIPTRDSARWIGAVARHYRRVGLDPLFVYDARSRDDTLAILRGCGFAPAIYEGSGADIVEGGILPFGAAACAARWVLRLDDDEFPARALIDFVAALRDEEDAEAYWLSTRELFAAGGRVYYSRHRYRYWQPGFGARLSPHLRLFRRDRAQFVAKLHSPGLEVPGAVGFAPQAAFHAHFSSVLRSFSERLAKVRGYDAMNPGMGWLYADEYLPELTSLAAHRARRDGLAEFAPLLATLPRPVSDAAPLEARDAAEFSAALARKWRLYYAERGGTAEMADSDGAPVGAFGWSPPPTLVIAPRRLLGLALEFGEFDFVARGNVPVWLKALAGSEWELVCLWGDPPERDAAAWLRGIAGRPISRGRGGEVETYVANGESGGFVRLGAGGSRVRKLEAVLRRMRI